MITCPYNSSHQIMPSRIQYHLVKCRERHPNADMFVCPFNATHHVPRSEQQYHIEVCPDQKLVEAEKYSFNEPVPNYHGNLSVPAYVNILVEDEGMQYSPVIGTYDTKRRARRTYDFRKLQSSKKSERRKFQVHEKETHQELNSSVEDDSTIYKWSQNHLMDKLVPLPMPEEGAGAVKLQLSPSLLKRRVDETAPIPCNTSRVPDCVDAIVQDGCTHGSPVAGTCETIIGTRGTCGLRKQQNAMTPGRRKLEVHEKKYSDMIHSDTIRCPLVEDKTVYKWNQNHFMDDSVPLRKPKEGVHALKHKLYPNFMMERDKKQQNELPPGCLFTPQASSPDVHETQQDASPAAAGLESVLSEERCTRQQQQPPELLETHVGKEQEVEPSSRNRQRTAQREDENTDRNLEKGESEDCYRKVKETLTQVDAFLKLNHRGKKLTREEEKELALLANLMDQLKHIRLSGEN